MIDFLFGPFEHLFMRRALVEGVLLAVLGSVVGVHVMLRRRAFLTEAVQHSVFPGIAIAFVLGWSLLGGAAVAAVATVATLAWLARREHVDSDAAMALLVSVSFALGVVVVSRRSGFQSDLTALLFGRILDVDGGQIVETAIAAAVCTLVLGALQKELLLRALDPIQAAALGYPVAVLDIVLDLAIATVVVVGVRALGTVLVVAFVVTPAAAARLVAHRVPSLTLIAAALSVSSVWLGLATSYYASVQYGVSLAAGATVVLWMTAAFALVAAIAPLRHRRARTAAA